MASSLVIAFWIAVILIIVIIVLQSITLWYVITEYNNAQKYKNKINDTLVNIRNVQKKCCDKECLLSESSNSSYNSKC
jgi:hypothetical protein